MSGQKLLGKYLGFPDCCIKFFTESSIPEIQKNWDVAKHTGYIPCNVCAERIRKGEIKLEELVGSSNPRLTEHPFPTNIEWFQDPGVIAYLEKHGYILA